MLEKKLGQVYALRGRAEHFRSVVYENTAHEYLPEQQTAMRAWIQKHLGQGAR